MGRCMEGWWWVAIFELTAGAYELRVEGVPELSGVTEEFSVDDDLLYRSTWEYVGLEQMETRVHFAPSGFGWQDCGAALQEANSHASCVIGLCDLLERRGSRNDADAARAPGNPDRDGQRVSGAMPGALR